MPLLYSIVCASKTRHLSDTTTSELSAKSLKSCDDDDDGIESLLLDARLCRATPHHAISSHITGMVATFLSECCEWERCPRGKAYVEGEILEDSEEPPQPPPMAPMFGGFSFVRPPVTAATDTDATPGSGNVGSTFIPGFK